MADVSQAGLDYSFLAGLDQPIQRPRTGIFYIACMVLVLFAMLLLPLIYFGLIGGLVWLISYHAVHDWAPIMNMDGNANGGGRVGMFKFLVYFVPICAGVVVLFFMFKPLLAGKAKRAQPLALNPADNPLLYAFIAKICDAVGAPVPKRIDMDCHLNASASFRRGFLSMTGNDLVLRIGLPLVANLSAREFAGVVAHEFGHFTQGFGMRLTYVIRSINAWFWRIAYKRDAWDEALESWSANVDDWRAAIIVWSLQLAVWSSRLILKLLLFLGHLASSSMLRQMEYDADAYAIQVVGSEAVESTHRKLAKLEAAMHVTHKQLRASWKKNRKLPDNLSELLYQAHEQLPPAVHEKIDGQLGLHRTSLFDAHPSPADRIRRARQASQPGIFHDERPAYELFSSFEHPARFVTLLYYTDELGVPVTEEMILRVQSTRWAEEKPVDVCHEYFLGLLPLLTPLRLAQPAPSADFESDTNELRGICASLKEVGAQLGAIQSQHSETTKQIIEARAARCLAEARVIIKPEAFGLNAGTVEAAQAAETEALAARDALQHSIREVGVALQRRLELALSLRLANHQEFTGDGVVPESIGEQILALNRLADEHLKQTDAANALAVLDRIRTLLDAEGETPPLARALEAQKNVVDVFMSGGQANTAEASGQKYVRHIGMNEIEKFRGRTVQWLMNYNTTLQKLVEIAASVEKIVL